MHKLILSLVLLSGSAMANPVDLNEVCLNRYRDATISLIDHAQALNQGGISTTEFIAEFAIIESQIGAKRLICAMEDPSIRECVRLYKKHYLNIRSNVDVIALAQGEQTKVKTGLTKAAMTVTDLRCQ